MSTEPQVRVNLYLGARTADELQPSRRRIDGMNKVAGLSWWVVGALVVIVAVSLMLANR